MKSCKQVNCAQNNPQPLTSFYVHAFTRDGRRNTCIECWKALHKRTTKQNSEYRAKNLDRIRARDRLRRSLPEDKKQKKQYDYKWRKLNSAEIRANLLKRNFNSTPDQYAAMLSHQGGCCAICCRQQSEMKKTFGYDHDHTCCPGVKSCGRCIRGILCDSCNRAIGLLGDDILLLSRAIEYLKKGHGK